MPQIIARCLPTRFVCSPVSTVQADAIIWDYATRSLKARCNLHKVKIEALAFSPSEKYLVTIGGQDDGSVVIWDVETGGVRERERENECDVMLFHPKRG